MKKFILLILTILLVSTAFSQRLWVNDSYIRYYNPVGKQDFYTPVWAITRLYVKDNKINIYSTETWSIDYASLTRYNDSSVPAIDVIVQDIVDGIGSASTEASDLLTAVRAGTFSRQVNLATLGDTLINETVTYAIPIDTTCVWGIYGEWLLNADTIKFIPMTSYKSVATLYPGLDTIVSTSATGTISFDDSMFSGDTLFLKVIATDTLAWDRLKAHLTK